MYCGLIHSESESDTLENLGFSITINKLLSVKSAVITPTSRPISISKVKTGQYEQNRRGQRKEKNLEFHSCSSCLVWKATSRHEHVTIWSDPSVQAICHSVQTFTYSCSH